MRKPIFIVGIPRSGSTLWLNVLSANRMIIGFDEMHFLSPFRKDFRFFFNKKNQYLKSNKNTRKMVELIFSKEQNMQGIQAPFWKNLKYNLNDDLLKEILYGKLIKSENNYWNIFRILVTEIVHFLGYDRCCLKFPVHFKFTQELINQFPDSKVVHITRDPRAIAISNTNDPGGTQKRIQKHPKFSYFLKKLMVVYSVIQYEWTAKIHRDLRLFKNYRLFQYEDLLFNPEEKIIELCQFTEIPFDKKMLNPKKGQASSISGSKSSGFDKVRATQWKKVISPREDYLITLLTKNSMRKLGYDYKNHPLIHPSA